MQRQRRFARRFRSVDLNNTALGQAADAQRHVQRQRAGGNRFHIGVQVSPSRMMEPFSVHFFNLLHRRFNGAAFYPMRAPPAPPALMPLPFLPFCVILSVFDCRSAPSDFRAARSRNYPGNPLRIFIKLKSPNPPTAAAASQRPLRRCPVQTATARRAATPLSTGPQWRGKLQPIGSAVQRQMRLIIPDGRIQSRQISRGNIGRIGYNALKCIKLRAGGPERPPAALRCGSANG